MSKEIIIVHTPTHDSYHKLRDHLRSKQKYANTSLFNLIDSYVTNKKDLCIRIGVGHGYNNDLGYGDKEYYTSDGFKILTLEEYFESEKIAKEEIKIDLPRRIRIRNRATFHSQKENGEEIKNGRS